MLSDQLKFTKIKAATRCYIYIHPIYCLFWIRGHPHLTDWLYIFVCCLLSFGLLIPAHGWYIVWGLKLFITFSVGFWLIFLEDKLFFLGTIVSFVIILLQFGSLFVTVLTWHRAVVLNLTKHGYFIGCCLRFLYLMRLLLLYLIHEFLMSSCTIWIRNLSLLLTILLLSVLVLMMFLITYIKGPCSSCIGALLSYPVQLILVVPILS